MPTCFCAIACFKGATCCSDNKGNVISWASAGFCGFKGSKKSTPFASQISTEAAMKKAIEYGIKQVDVVVRGPGSGREMALRAIQAFGVGIVSIKDITPLPHNGCRPSKRRRV